METYESIFVILQKDFSKLKNFPNICFVISKICAKNDQGTTCHNPTAESESAANQALSVQARQSWDSQNYLYTCSCL